MAKTEKIKISSCDDNALTEISRNGLLSLSIVEMRRVQKYFTKIGREPTDLELEMIAQTWSEHCFHKTFKSQIKYTEVLADLAPTTVEISSLFSLIKEATDILNKKWCISVFRDNAGIIEFDKSNCICFKVETHNHPSALEPYGGAGTGIGGVIRDILGAGLGAKPILNTDVFCFGPLSISHQEIPEGIFHPKRIFKGVVSGVRDYGNRMGIPTANGAILFDEGYLYNVLVYCGTVGIMPKWAVEKEVKPGHLIVVIGNRTGRDGIHGATFSSASLEKDIPTSVVQIGNPIIEKKVLDALMLARDEKLYSAITDCGAGGLSSAVGELSQDCGAVVHLEKVLLKYSDLKPWEIWISESQERMVLAVPPRNFSRLKEILVSEDVEYACIGNFTSTKKIEIYDEEDLVGNLDLDWLFQKGELPVLEAYFEERKTVSIIPENIDIVEVFLHLISDSVIASKELVVRQYDHEVQAHTIIKPMLGVDGLGPSDAVVLAPLYGSYRGIVVSCGINPWYGMIDPYHMAGCCIDEAMRNIVACGGDPERVSLLDNFCWGNCNDSLELGKLARCVKGCRDFALKYGVPFISGKDSLNNFFTEQDKTIVSIPGTLLISAISVIKDVRKTMSSDFKSAGNLIYILGETKNELGGSRLFHILNIEGGRVPEVSPEINLSVMRKLYNAINQGLVRSCHDCSEGGLIITISEMMIGSGYGVEIDIEKILTDIKEPVVVLFSESQGRFIVEVDESCVDRFEKLFQNLPCACIGRIIPAFYLKVFSGDNQLLNVDGEEIKQNWRGALEW
ncbi:MAG: Phosphoribosylformylglycinamidine synthase 2 [candidate division TA06 bacterium ADurb.Bin131]|uniref:Phosphoribosylformylglycinamidine synthase subunit PurL n=1 Tax=candidate division TA06 bacterium ADurb.Bin131 TaxID=1852827 RepID=A0A1V6CB72_UNCT6|nr:MAG: Phosphoribosylformylglycinamidine synthase 2 [candidate division TA06 bacterium ADurb.Bin131]